MTIINVTIIFFYHFNSVFFASIGDAEDATMIVIVTVRIIIVIIIFSIFS